MSKILQGQSFFNKVLEQTGDLENSIEMALLNNISITEDVVIGDRLTSASITNNYVADYFSERKPANKTLKADVLTPTNGIGYMKIETTFKVS